MYDRLSNIFGKDRATGIGAQTPIDIVEDLNMDTEHERDTNFDNLDTSSPMSVNQPVNSETAMPSKSSGRKRLKAKDDLAKGFGEVASNLFKQLSEKFDKSEANYPKYLAEELDRLGFPISDNLKISKAMRSDPSNVEVFKIIKNDDDKIVYAKTFLEG